MIIGVINQKGGVGKTTSTFLLGELCSKIGLRTLIMGLDGQAELNKHYFGDNLTSDANLIIEDVESCIYNIKENLDFIPTPDVEELDKLLSYDEPTTISHSINKIKDYYDVILIDSPPSRGKIFYNIINASEKFLIPMKTNYLDVIGSVALIEILKERRGEEIGEKLLLLPTMFNPRVNNDLSAVCVIYSYAISAYNNFSIDWEEVNNLLYIKRLGKTEIEEMPKNINTMKRRLSKICEDYGLKYTQDILLKPTPEVKIYEDLFLLDNDDFEKLLYNRNTFIKYFYPYLTILKHLNDKFSNMKERDIYLNILKNKKKGEERE